MLSILGDALDVGLANEVLEACAKLQKTRVLAEPIRIRALAATHRLKDARRAAIALAHEWLAPPTNKDATNQQLLRGDILKSLQQVTVAGDPELSALAEQVRLTILPIYFPEGDEF